MNLSYAIFLCGNPGVGKSTLSNALGANFDSGFSIGEGLTKNVSTCPTTLNGEEVLLIDAPGMYEASRANTRSNTHAIREALKYKVPYKIGFVVTLNAGRWLAQDIALIDKIVEMVKSNGEGPISYILIINQVQEKYSFNQDTLREMVEILHEATMTKPEFSRTLICPYVPNPDDNAILREILTNAFVATPSHSIRLNKELLGCPEELAIYVTGVYQKLQT